MVLECIKSVLLVDLIRVCTFTGRTYVISFRVYERSWSQNYQQIGLLACLYKVNQIGDIELSRLRFMGAPLDVTGIFNRYGLISKSGYGWLTFSSYVCTALSPAALYFVSLSFQSSRGTRK